MLIVLITILKLGLFAPTNISNGHHLVREDVAVR